MVFSLQQFKAARRRKRIIGILAFWAGLFLFLLDVFTSFPTPIRGAFTLWWLAVIAIGGIMWMASKRLPLEETVEIARKPLYGGELMVTNLTGELNTNLSTAEKILKALEAKGYARREDRGETSVWVFPEVKQTPPSSTTDSQRWN